MSDDTQDQTGQELVQSTGGATKELRPGEWPFSFSVSTW